MRMTPTLALYAGLRPQKPNLLPSSPHYINENQIDLVKENFTELYMFP
jgi:hypothetical protein